MPRDIKSYGHEALVQLYFTAHVSSQRRHICFSFCCHYSSWDHRASIITVVEKWRWGRKAQICKHKMMCLSAVPRDSLWIQEPEKAVWLVLQEGDSSARKPEPQPAVGIQRCFEKLCCIVEFHLSGSVIQSDWPGCKSRDASSPECHNNCSSVYGKDEWGVNIPKKGALGRWSPWLLVASGNPGWPLQVERVLKSLSCPVCFYCHHNVIFHSETQITRIVCCEECKHI